MWQQLNSSHFRVKRQKIVFILAGLGIIGLLLVGCGGSNASNGTVTSAPANYAMNSAQQKMASGSQASATSPQSSQSGPSGQTGQYGPQYLVKSLQVTMEVQNPLQSANELQQWVAFSDPQSTSDGSDYENAGNGQYTVTLTFLVDVAHYTQVEAYLRDYAGQKGHTWTV